MQYARVILAAGIVVLTGAAWNIHAQDSAMGTPIFDSLDLEAVAEYAAAAERWEFAIATAPLRIPGGTGSPLNPIAIF